MEASDHTATENNVPAERCAEVVSWCYILLEGLQGHECGAVGKNLASKKEMSRLNVSGSVLEEGSVLGNPRSVIYIQQLLSHLNIIYIYIISISFLYMYLYIYLDY